MNLLHVNTSDTYNEFNRLFDVLKKAILNDKEASTLEKLKASVEEVLRTFDDLTRVLNEATTMTVMDENGYITYVDHNFCELSKYNRDQILGKTQHFLESNHHEEAFFSNMWATIRRGETWDGEIKNLAQDGTPFWVKTTIVPLLNEEGIPYSYVEFRTDITLAKEQEAQLLDAVKNDFRRTVKALVNLVFKLSYCEKTDEYFYTLLEGKLAEDLGLTTERVEGKRLEEIFDADLSTLFKYHFSKAFHGESVTFKNKFINRYFYTTLSPIKENGEVVEVIGSSLEITEYEEAELRIRHMAYHDPLTDLPNRRKLREDLELTIEHSNTNGQPFAVMFIDLDRFKYINDTLGHTAGDQVIISMAARIQEVLSYKDELYRFGGDEFIIMIQDARDMEEVEQMGYFILKEIEKPMNMMGREFFLTASMGICLYPVGGESADQLVTNADIALHYCKMNGRQGMLVYSPEMNKAYHDLVNLEGELRRAVNQDELMLYYQPKVNVDTGKVEGMEALIRWLHPEKGFISPGKFIPVAEETGLIIQMGEWVLREACRQNQEWMNKGYAPHQIAVNVSALELQKDGFVSRVSQILRETKLPPECLEIEITENSVMQNTEECIEIMYDLRALGISLSIDDFGTGYSSLGYLRRFPIHYLKIDRTFIQDVLVDSSNAEIVKAMIQLGHTFQLKVVAEGVEEKEILHFLQDQQCDFYQGYYYSKPISASEFEKLLTSQQTTT